METVAQKDGRLQLVSEITQSINLGNSLEEVFHFIYSRLHEFIPYNRIGVAVQDEKQERLTSLVARSDGKLILQPGFSGAIKGSSLEGLMREGKTRIINDLQEYLAQNPQSESTRLIVKEGMRSNLTLPLMIQGKPIGVMFFASRRPSAYGPEHEEFLRSIAGHVSIAIERSRLMDAFRDKSSYLEEILHHSADAIIVEDESGIIRTWNEGARRIYGYESEEVIGRPFLLLVPPGFEAELEEIRARVNREGFVRDMETVRVTKDGRRVLVNLTSTRIRHGRSIIQRDVTHVKKLQQELVRTQSLAAVGELAATIAHEIKNPLAGISGAIQIMKDAIPDSDHRKEVVTQILEQIQRLDNTVRDLLTFSRPAVPDQQEVDLCENLERSWSLLAQQPGADRVEFVCQCNPVRVQADPNLLSQVWINVFQNAIEAMPNGGEVRVRILDGDPVRIEIEDTGTGVDAAHAPKIFRPFFSTKTRGTGLGLAISRKIVEAHRGTIRLDSRPKKGTIVCVEIPK